MILIHHVLQSLLLPPLNGLLIIILGIILLIISKLKTATVSLCIGFAILYLQSTPFFVYSISRLFENSKISKLEFKNSEALIVLGGGIKTNAFEYPLGFNVNSWTLMRIEYAAFLAKQDPTKLIIVSGGIATPKNHSEAFIMKKFLIDSFNVKNPIILEEKSRNTNENAKYVTAILKQKNIHKVALISQAIHMKRAIALFKKFGVNAYAAPTDYMSSNNIHHNTFTNFIPNAYTMLDCAFLLHEIIGYFLYIDLNFENI